MLNITAEKIQVRIDTGEPNGAPWMLQLSGSYYVVQGRAVYPCDSLDMAEEKYKELEDAQ